MQFKARFLRLVKPTIRQAQPEPSIETISVPTLDQATLLLKDSAKISGLREGMRVKTGELVREGDGPLFLSPLTGKLTSIRETKGYLNRPMHMLTFNITGEDQYDPLISELIKAEKKRELLDCLNLLPGAEAYPVPKGSGYLDCLIVNALERDPFAPMNALLFKNYQKELVKGIQFLKDITKRLVFVSPEGWPQLGITGLEGMALKAEYPYTLPQVVVKKVVGKEIGKDKDPVKEGVGIVSPYQAILIGLLLESGRLEPIRPMYVTEAMKSRMIIAKIGTRLKDILENVGTSSFNCIISSGLMRGETIYDLDMPVMPSMDSIFVYYKVDKSITQERECINCGECVRICPARIQVNLLVRYLKNKKYEDATSLCDLMSCMECGMCSFVCVSHIPVFHYIMWGKYEMGLINNKEASNA